MFEFFICFFIVDALFNFFVSVIHEFLYVFELAGFNEFFYFLGFFIWFFIKVFKEYFGTYLCSKWAADCYLNVFAHAKGSKVYIAWDIWRTFVKLSDVYIFVFFILNVIKAIITVWIRIFIRLAPIKLKPLILIILYIHSNIQRRFFILATYRQIATCKFAYTKRWYFTTC